VVSWSSWAWGNVDHGEVSHDPRGHKKHVRVLEQAGLVTTQKVGRLRTYKLGPSRLAEETAWIEDYRRLWASRFDALDQIVEELKQRETFDGRRRTE
jgi:hypothetical protein